MASWLLYPKSWYLTIDKDEVSQARANDLTKLERTYQRKLTTVESMYRGSMYGSFFKQIIKNFITTGWLTFSCFPSEPNWSFTPVNPAKVYVEYDSRGFVSELVRKYSLSASEAISRIVEQGWIIPDEVFKTTVTVRMYWKVDFGIPHYTVMMNNYVVKPYGPYYYDYTDLTKVLPYIPIYCAPGGGLPDDGSISTTWREELGQSFVSGILHLQKNYDKMLTYMQQILRDTANPKWVQRTTGQGPLTSENVNRRGLVLSINPGEDIFSPPNPPLPPEMRTQQMDIRSQIQRGTFTDLSFGNFSAQVSVYLMSQATASAQQVLEPFQDGIKRSIGSVLTHFARMEGKLTNDENIQFNYDIQIPGDLINRANTARILNPQYKLSKDSITRLMFPEITSNLEEQSKIAIEDAMSNEIGMTIQSINQYRQAAADAMGIRDTEMSNLLLKAANVLEQRLASSVTPNEQQPAGGNMLEQAINEALASGG